MGVAEAGAADVEGGGAGVEDFDEFEGAAADGIVHDFGNDHVAYARSAVGGAEGEAGHGHKLFDAVGVDVASERNLIGSCCSTFYSEVNIRNSVTICNRCRR